MLRIDTEPSGATVTLSAGEAVCIAPCELEVRRRGALTVAAELDGCGREEVAVDSRIDRFGGWMLGAYGGAALAALAYDIGEDVAEAIAPVVPAILVCGALGADPANCLPGQEEDDDLYALLPIVPASVDLGTGALFARTPNPLRIVLDCR
ncbi:MAG: hypothetical protein OXQ29_19550 [Rhodospirillaceae bacterium]|nr:hypothetical protein [Rhodospirillaceae bacterium]